MNRADENKCIKGKNRKKNNINLPTTTAAAAGMRDIEMSKICVIHRKIG